ncbi:MAG: glutamine--fructose-6-phosphate transaminase (isomerizing), partial [Dehalococcoidia bacterium]|nr:glutamine--fructose-6-phosphate transaminase (isomerizing) [Dehalococcoidia bacterium]
MCGITGYCGKKLAGPIVFEALKRLEYRGYDSAGVASLSDDRLLIRKGVGGIDEVNQKCHLDNAPGTTAIGHTRWATHGTVTCVNSHPHSDSEGRIAVVHNGIIENYQELRQELISKGHLFNSETDTEVIPNLLAEELKNGTDTLEQAVLTVSRRLRGSYAFVALAIDDPDKLVGTRKNNPLVVGFDNEGCYLCSDTLAFPEAVTGQVMLGDAEVVMLSSEGVRFFDANGDSISREPCEVNKTWAQSSSKNGYPHFMLKEIMEQPQILEFVIQQDEKKFQSIALDILRAHQVIITACGTSRYASLVGRYLFSRVARKFADVIIASEFGYFADSVDKSTMVIAVSQSGETADVVEGIKTARVAGGQILSIVNRPSSVLESLSQRTISLNCGCEVGVAATKTFLSQLAAFYLMSFSMVNAFDEACSQVGAMRDKIAEALDCNNHRIIELAQQLKNKNDFYYLARGINFAVASEGALKLKEIAYVHAEGMPAGELKHGTLALIEKGTPVLGICPNDHTYDEIMNNLMEVKARGAYVIGVSDRESDIYDF